MASEKECAEKLISNFASLSDVTLIAGIDNTKCPVIRKIISKSSQYFETLLGPNFREGNEDEIVLKSVDGPTLKSIICYIYAGYIELTKDNIENVLSAASGMELVALEEKCAEYLQENLTNENCVNTLLLADRYSLNQPKKSALSRVCTHFEYIPTDYILPMSSDSLLQILKSDKIQIPETKIFECLVEWVKKNETERAKFVPEHLKYIRLQYIPGQYLRKYFEPFYRKYGCIDLLLDEYGKRMLASEPNGLNLYRCPKPFPNNIYYAVVQHSKIKIYKYATSKWDTFKIISHNAPSGSRFGMVFLDKTLYIMGGVGANNTYSSDVECHEMNTWNRKTLPKMQLSRAEFQPIAYGKSIYVFGGKNATGCLQECERFDTGNNSWNVVPKMPFQLCNYSVVEIDGKVYLAGGTNGAGAYSNAVFCYDTSGSKWTIKTYISGAVSDVSLAKLRKTLYVMMKGTASVLHAYDPKKDIWTEIGSFQNSTFLSAPIDYFGQMYAFHKQCHNGFLSTINFGKVNLKDKRFDSESCAFAGNIYMNQCGICFTY